MNGFTALSSSIGESVRSRSAYTDLNQAKPTDDAHLETAKEFESVFIAQMLSFSGLGEALTKTGGSDASAFSSFYLSNLAEKISENGGFGVAEKVYQKLLTESEISDVDYKKV